MRAISRPAHVANLGRDPQFPCMDLRARSRRESVARGQCAIQVIGGTKGWPHFDEKAWTLKYMTWIQEHVHFHQPALEATLLDYIHEVEHMAERILRLEKAIAEAIQTAPSEIRAVIEALQALWRGSTDRCHRGGRTRLFVALSQSAAIDGLQRSGFE
jgi:hypothetical protein